MVTTDKTSKESCRKRRSLHRWLMDVTGNEWCGSAGPPLANHSIYVHDDGVTRVFSMQDDGGFVGIGYPDEWHVIMRTKAARMFAWWTFKLWLRDWCGLRQWVWYTALHRSVGGKWEPLWWLRNERRTAKFTRPSSHDEWSRTR